MSFEWSVESNPDLRRSVISLNRSEKNLKKLKLGRPGFRLFGSFYFGSFYMCFPFLWLAVVTGFDYFGFGFATLNPKLRMLRCFKLAQIWLFFNFSMWKN